MNKNSIVFLILTTLLFLAAGMVCADDWYDSNWKYRQKITVSSTVTDSDLTNFPLLVQISQPDEIALPGTGDYDAETDGIFLNTQADADDILFTSSDGLTKIPHEIEFYEDNDTDREIYAWVKIPTLNSGSDTTIYMYYGNTASGNQEDTSNVWDEDYVLVMHLNENVADEQTTGIHYDSTSNGSNGVQHENELEDHTAAGITKIAGAQRFETATGAEDYINIDNIDSDDWTAYTLTGWFYHIGGYAGDPRIIAKSVSPDPATHIFSMTERTAGELRGRITTEGDASAFTYQDGALALSPLNWYYGSVVWEGTATDNLHLRRVVAGTGGVDPFTTVSYDIDAVNGQNGATLGNASAVQNVVIGNSAVGGDRGHNGIIDEIRISKVARSQNWLEAEFRNSDNPVSYQTFEEQIYVSGTVYSDRGSTPAGSGVAVAIYVEGGAVYTAATDSSGKYFIPIPTSANIATKRLLLFRDNDNAYDAGDGATVTVSNGENLSGLDLYQGHIIVRNDNGGDPSVADLSAADNADDDIPYNVAGGVTLSSNIDLYVPAGTTFLPAAAVTTAGASGDLVVDGSMTLSGNVITAGNVSGSGSIAVGTNSLQAGSGIDVSTLTLSSGSVTISGNWSVANFTPGTGSVTFNGNGEVPSGSFYDLEVSGGTMTATGALTVTNSLSLTGGTFDPGPYSHSVAGNWDDTSAVFTPSQGTIILTGTNPTINQLVTNNFNNLTLLDGASLLSAIAVDNDLTISSGTLTGNSLQIDIAGTWTNNGTYTAGATGTVAFVDNTKNSSILGTTTFQNLTIDGRLTSPSNMGKTLSFEAGLTQTVAGTFFIQGDLDGASDIAYVSLSSTPTSGGEAFVNATGAVNIDYAVIQYINAVTPISVDNCVDLGNNTSITFNSSPTIYTWTGATNINWQDELNWDSGDGTPGNDGIPTGIMTAVINSSVTPMPVLTTDFYEGGVTVVIGDGASLDIAFYDFYIENHENQGIIYQRPLGDIDGGTEPVDDDSGTYVYQDASGAIRSDGGSYVAYYNLEATGSGLTYTFEAATTTNGYLKVDQATVDAGANNLTIGGDLLLDSSGTFQGGTVAASHSVAGSVSGNGTFEVENSAISVTGNFTPVAVTSGTGTLTVSGSWNPGSFNLATGSVILDFGGSISSGSFNNLTVASGTRTATGDITVNGNLVINGILDMGSYNLSVTGDVSGTGELISGSGDIDVDGDFEPVNFTDSSGNVYIAQMWNVTGSYTPGTSTVYFDGATASLNLSAEFFNLTIESGAVLTTGSNALNIDNIYNNLGEIRRNGGSYVSQIDIDSGLTTYITGGDIQDYIDTDYYDLKIDAATLVTTGHTRVTNDFIIEPGAIINASHTIVVWGNWDNNAGVTGYTYTGQRAVQLQNSAKVSTVTGDTNFSHLRLDHPGKTVEFESGRIQTVNNLFEVLGEPGNLVTLRGTTAATWTINNVGNIEIVEYADVQYSEATGNEITANRSIDSGFNDLGGAPIWDFVGSNFTWLGATSTWGDQANWDSGDGTPGDDGFPGASDSILIPDSATTTADPLLVGARTVTDVTIETDGILDVAGQYLTISGTLENQGIIRRFGVTDSVDKRVSKTDIDSGTTVYYGAGAGGIQDYGAVDYYDLEFDGATYYTDRNLSVAGNLSITATGELDASTDLSPDSVTVAGDFLVAGTFTPGPTVFFIDNSKTSTISGSNTFTDLTINTPGKTVYFTDGTTQNVTGSFTVQGTSSSFVSLLGTGALGWTITALSANDDIDYARVQYSTATNALIANDSIDLGNNNANWTFPGTGGFFSWTGTSSTTWADQANWDIGDGTPGNDGFPVAGEIAIILDVSGGSGNFPILASAVTVENLTIVSGASLDTQGNTLTITGQFDNDGTLYRRGGDSVNQTDTDSGTTYYRTDAGGIQDYSSNDDYFNLTLDGAAFTVSSDLETAGNLVIGDVAGTNTGTLTSDAFGVTVDGNLTGGGSFTSGISGVEVAGDWGITTFNPNGGIVNLSGTGNLALSTFEDLNITGGVRTLTGTVTVTGDITLSGGELQPVANTINVNGNWSRTGGIFTYGTGNVVFDDNTKTSVISGSTTFYDFSSGLTAAGKTIQFEAGSTQTIFTGGDFNVNGSDAGNRIILESTAPGTNWILDLEDAATVTVDFLEVQDCDLDGAAPSPLTASTTGSIKDNGNNDDTAAIFNGDGGDAAQWNFTQVISVISRETIDSDGNGQIDRIRITTDTALDDDFTTDPTVALGSGYVIDVVPGFSTGITANDAVFDIHLIESGSEDTGVTPTVDITAAGTLADFATSLINLALDSTAVASTDSAPPTLVSATLANTGGNNWAEAGDTITFVYGEALDPATITASLEGGNSNNSLAIGSGSITGTLSDLIAELGYFAVPGNIVTAGDSSLTMPAGPAGTTVLITLGTVSSGIVEPSGITTPYISYRDSVGNLVSSSVTPSATGSFGDVPASWTGALDSDWSKPGNWNPAAIPGAGSSVIITALGSSPELVGDVTVTNLEIQNLAVLSLDGNNLTVSGDFDILNNGTLRLDGSETVSAINNNSGTIHYDGAAGTVNHSPLPTAGSPHNHVIFNDTEDGDDTWTLGAALSVGGNLTITTGSFDLDGNNLTAVTGTFLIDTNGQLTLAGNETVDTINTNNGTINYKGAAGTVNHSPLPTAGSPHNHVIFNDSSDGDDTWTLGSGLTVGGNLTVTSATLAAAANDLAVTGSLTHTGALTSTSGNISITGISSIGGNITTTGGNITLTGNVTLTANSVLTSAGGTSSFGGTVNGVFDLSIQAAAASGAVSFTGAVGNTDNLVNITINTDSAVVLPAVTYTGLLNVTSGSTITDSGIIDGGTLSTSSDGGTVLNNANTVTSFTAANITGGNIELVNTTATLNVTGVSQAGGGDVLINNTGALSVTGAVGNAAGNVNLTSSGAISDSGAINTGTLTTVSDGGAILDQGHTITTFNGTNTTGGNIQLLNTAATLSVSGISQAGGGNVIISNTGALSVTGAVGNAAGNVNLTSSTAISDSGAINTGILTTSSDSGTILDQGHTVSSFTATNTTSGNIELVNTAAPLTITAANIAQYAGGTVDIDNTGAIVLTGTINTGDTGTVNLDTLGTGTITGAGTITAGTVNLQRTASSTGAVGTAGISIETTRVVGTTSLSVGQGAGIAGLYVNHTGNLTVPNLLIAVNNPVEIIASGTLGLSAAAINTGTANIDLQSGGAFTLSTNLTTSSGTINVQSTGSTVTVNNPVSSTVGGAVTVTASGGTLAVDNTISSTGGAGGTVDLTSSAAISDSATINTGTLTTISDGGTILDAGHTVLSFNGTNTTGGNIQLVNTAAPLSVSGISQAGGGNVIISNTGALSVTGAIGNGAGNVNLTSSGAISDSAAINTVTLTTSSSGGIVLDQGHTVSAFNGTNTASGNIQLVNTAAPLSVSGISQAGGGNVIISNTGALSVTGAIGNGAGNVNLTSSGIISDSGAINTLILTTVSDGGSILDQGHTVSSFNATNTTGGNIQLINTAAPLSVSGISQAGGGNVIINNTGALSVTGGIGNAAGNVNLTSSGAISDTAAINTGTLTTVSDGGTVLDQGHSIAIFNAGNTTSGDIRIDNTVNLEISGISQAGGGNVTVNTSAIRDVTVSGGISAGTTAVIDINSGAAFTLNNGIVIAGTTGNITVDTTGANALTVNGNITTTGAGTVSLTGTNAITMDADSLIQTVDGAVSIVSAAGGITADVIESTNNADITLTATLGSIEEADNTARIGAAGSSSILLLTAGTNIGNTNAVNTDAGTLRIAAAGVVDINEAGAVILGNGGGGINSTGGNVTVTAAGNITTGNTVTTTTGTGGSITLATTGGGSVTLDHTLSTVNNNGITITNDGLLTVNTAVSSDGIFTQNGAGSVTLAAGITTTNDNIDLLRAVTVAADIALSSGGAGLGDITLSAAVDGDGTPNSLTLTAGTGDVNLAGAAGSTQALSALTITGNDITLTGIGGAASGVTGNVSVTGTDGADNSRVTLSGGTYWSTGIQIYNSGTDQCVVALTGSGNFNAGGAGITFDDVYFDLPGWTISMIANLTCDQFVFYRGTINLNGNTITTTADFAAFGPGYDPTDSDMATTNPNNTLFAYPAAGAFTYYPAGGTYAGGPPVNFSTAPTSVFTIPVGSVITVGGNFYNNGANMDGAGAWTLNIQDNSASDPVTNGEWGSPYAVAFNMSVENSTAAGGWVAATVSQGGVPAEINNNVTDTTPASCTNWDFTRPQITSAETVYDNVIRVTFSENLENSNGEIAARAGSVLLDDNTIAFTGTFTDAECTTATGTTEPINIVYFQTTNTTWNTDATGTSAGVIDLSTDRSGSNRNVTAGINIFPDIAMLKGIFYSAEGKTFVRNYSNNTYGEYNGTTDECRPVLAAVTADRDAGTTEAYNYHNYFQLNYSEPVNLGTHADFLIGSGTPAANTRAQGTFAAGEYGGSIEQNGADVDVTGLFSYLTATLTKGSKDGTPEINSLYRANTGGAANSAADNGMRIFIAGYSTGADPNQTYPGYISAVTDPVGEVITVPANALITDSAGNILENTAGSVYAKAAVTVAGAGWDIDPPSVSGFRPGGVAGSYHEILTQDIDTDNLIDRLEFHLHDNSADNGAWNSSADHPDGTAGEGIRDTSVVNNSTGFKINSVGNTTVKPASGFTFVTDIDNALYDPGVPPNVINTANDMYFAITFNDTELPLNYLTRVILSYESNIGYITDLSGNLLPATVLDLNCYELVPPNFSYTLSIAGDNKIFVEFSEYVYGDAAQTISVNNLDFNLAPYNVTSVTHLEQAPDTIGTLKAFLNLDAAISTDDAVNLFINPAGANIIYDALGTSMLATETHRFTDIGMGIIEPAWADDGYESDVIQSGGALKVFDGTGRLHDRDITLQASILAPTAAASPANIFFDADVPSSYYWNDLWLPVIIPGFTPLGNTAARGSAAYSSSGNLRNFLIPENDSEMKSGKDLDFILRVGGLYCARAKDPNDPRTVAPWNIKIRDAKKQRSGVTILNNVINPLEGEKTILQYSLEKSGSVTINIFSLSGDVVKTLYKGRQPSGNYSFTWDGKNAGGRAVARGIYFIRIVGPDIDEYRKVMVVK